MYYRIEGSESIGNKWTDWYGIANVLCGGENTKAFRGIAVPKCLRSQSPVTEVTGLR